ncbi:hypothetical protein GGI12_002573 [Dipsacomyces acuminosporus]|nr:hypothetical protein GGI12_002573 [Dipsacomyces acuminosporus]
MASSVPPALDNKATAPSEAVVKTIQGLQAALSARRGVSATAALEEDSQLAQVGAGDGFYKWEIDDEVERKWCVQWLTRVVEWATRRSMLVAETDDAQETLDGWTRAMDAAAELLAELCGKGASGPVQRRVRLWGSDGRALPGIAIHEPSFVQADVGCQTWGSAVLLARRIARGSIDISKHRACLELGSGTGLLGLTVGRVLQSLGGSIVMTDYLQSLLKVIKDSADANGLLSDGTVVAKHLDWFEVAGQHCLARNCEQQPTGAIGGKESGVPLAAPKVNYADVTARESGDGEGGHSAAEKMDVDSSRSSFDLVVAADVLYEVEHARVIPVLADYLLASLHESSMQAVPRFIITVPLRSTHWSEIETFETEVARIRSLCLVAKDDASLADDLSAWKSTLDRKGGHDLDDGGISQALESDSSDAWSYRTYIFERRVQ